MNIANSPAVQSTANAVASKTGDAVNILMLKKALNVQAQGAAALLQALPQPPLATSGPVGTKVNTFA